MFLKDLVVADLNEACHKTEFVEGRSTEDKKRSGVRQVHHKHIAHQL